MVVAPAAGRGTAVAPRTAKSKKAKSKKAKAKTATATRPAPASGSAATLTQPATAGAATAGALAPERRAAKSKDQRAKTGRKRHPILIALGVGVVVAGGGGAAVAVPRLMHPSGPAHTVTTPERLLSYVQNPALAKGLDLQALRNDILKKGNGEASHVVDAVYEDSVGPGTSSGPLIVLFIGGNLSGSASSFISSFTGMLSGSFVTSSGSLGGQAACVPGVSGHPAECAWADNDSFGLIASPTLSARALGAQLRQIRPLVEHDSK
jgi:hypothetical protein